MPENTPGKAQELWQELRSVLAGRQSLLDSLLPPVVFLILNALAGFTWAIGGALSVALLIALWRLFKGQALWYALGGVGGVLLAVLLARWLGGSEGYFLPGLLSGGGTVLLCLVSVIVKRPLVAWTSYLTRRWPLGWYWHPQVRPAYSEVTLAWAVFFGLRTYLQYLLYQQGAGQTLGWVQLLTGWPAILVLLVLSYLYGLWRLKNLNGPSVEEFQAGEPPPWDGQQRGF
ncbi:MAG: DUF3159 domain-containing protein [Anaerolineales bacterium]|nr:DUF3159 domain-containing protein [Anaerolineales bacterium]